MDIVNTEDSATIENFPEIISKCISAGEFEIALKLVKKMLLRDTESLEGQYFLAKILYEKKNYVLAADRLRYMINNKINMLHTENMFLLFKLLGLCYYALGKIRLATDCFLQTSRTAINIIDKAQWYSNYLLMSNYLDDITNEELIRRHLEYNTIFLAVKQYQHKSRIRKKLRIGYISPDFREHVVVYFAYQLLAKYDKSRYEVTCFSRGGADAITEQLKILVDNWCDITNLSDDVAAALIYEKQIDILVDLSGHSSNNCLPILSRRPAPIQISGIGYVNTTGLKTIDYFLTDVFCDPINRNDADFCEKLLRLPHSHFCYTPPNTVLTYQDIHKEHNGIIFGCFNNFAKITDKMLRLWLTIVNKVEGSKLVLKSPHFIKIRDQSDILLRAIQIGFTKKQLDIRSATVDYLEEYNTIDIALDTYPYPGGGTTCEALYMGVPVITLIGERHGSRFGYSILKNIGIEALAADSPEKYVEIAVALSEDKKLLRLLHNSLRKMFQMSPLMNGKKYMVEVEHEYERIWEYWLKNEG